MEMRNQQTIFSTRNLSKNFKTKTMFWATSSVRTNKGLLERMEQKSKRKKQTV